MSDTGISPTVDQNRIVDDLMNAYRVCRQTAAAGAPQQATQADAERWKAFDDCADLNLALANFLIRESPSVEALARLTAEVTETCAQAIRDIEHDAAQLRAPYAMCQRVYRNCMVLLGEESPDEQDAIDEAVAESFPASDPPPPPTEL